jgi:hypothetical protein
VDIEEFYDANPARRASEEVELGRDWTDSSGARCELSWVEATGELYVMAEPTEAILIDPVGDMTVESMPTKLLTVEVLATIPTREVLEGTLAGWREAMPQPNSLGWVRGRVAQPAAARAGEGHRAPAREDESATLPGAGDASSPMISALLEALGEHLPACDQGKLDAYRRRAEHAGAHPTAEWHRAYRCAQWADEIVALPAQHHLAAEADKARQVVREITETIGAELRDLQYLPRGRSVSPRFQAELAWVLEAVHVAQRVAAKIGWDNVPWERLLDDVLAVPSA